MRTNPSQSLKGLGNWLKRLNPRSLASNSVAAFVVALVGTVFAVLAYFKDAGDPRVALVSRGVPWQQEKFFEAIRIGDIEVIKLFLQGGMSPNAGAADRQLPIFLASNFVNPAATLSLLLAHNFNVNAPFPSSYGPNFPLVSAINNDNVELVRALMKAGARADQPLNDGLLSAGVPATPYSEAVERAGLGYPRSAEVLAILKANRIAKQ